MGMNLTAIKVLIHNTINVRLSKTGKNIKQVYDSLLELATALAVEVKRAKDAEASIEAKLLFRNIKVDANTGELYLIYEAEFPDDGDIAVPDLYSEVATLDNTSREYLTVTNETGNSVVVNNSNI